MIVEYIDLDEPLQLFEVMSQCRVDEGEEAYLAAAIIPAARALAESKTGCAIRQARYRDTFADASRCVLSMGGVLAVESVTVGGAPVAFTSTVQARRTCISAPDYAGKECIVTYTAGTDIDKHPGVRAWMLLVCGWLYAQRELLGGDNSEPPPHIAESLLASINVAAGF